MDHQNDSESVTNILNEVLQLSYIKQYIFLNTIKSELLYTVSVKHYGLQCHVTYYFTIHLNMSII